LAVLGEHASRNVSPESVFGEAPNTTREALRDAYAPLTRRARNRFGPRTNRQKMSARTF
jgi:hypothetical protein